MMLPEDYLNSFDKCFLDLPDQTNSVIDRSALYCAAQWLSDLTDYKGFDREKLGKSWNSKTMRQVRCILSDEQFRIDQHIKNVVSLCYVIRKCKMIGDRATLFYQLYLPCVVTDTSFFTEDRSELASLLKGPVCCTLIHLALVYAEGKQGTKDIYSLMEPGVFTKHEHEMGFLDITYDEFERCWDAVHFWRLWSPCAIGRRLRKRSGPIGSIMNNNLWQISPAAGLMLMYALGLRNNEASGMNFGYIREFSEYPGNYYLLVPQSTELGANSLKVMGKTANSGRRIPLPDRLAKDLLELQSRRAELAADKGYTGSPEDLPIACRRRTPWERCSSDDLSSAARSMFKTIGMRMEELVGINQELMEDAQGAVDEAEDDEFRQIESEPTAYLLRRNFATHIAALGLDDAEIRYVIGHKIEDEYIQRRSFGDEKMLMRIKRKMDQRPLLNLIETEASLPIAPGSPAVFSGSKKIVMHLAADRLSSLRISATAREAGDEIRIRVVNPEVMENASGELIAYSKDAPVTPSRTIDGMRYYQNQF